jgi:hypothetical protein
MSGSIVSPTGDATAGGHETTIMTESASSPPITPPAMRRICVEQVIRNHPRERIDLASHSEGGLIGGYYVQKPFCPSSSCRLDGGRGTRLKNIRPCTRPLRREVDRVEHVTCACSPAKATVRGRSGRSVSDLPAESGSTS